MVLARDYQNESKKSDTEFEQGFDEKDPTGTVKMIERKCRIAMRADTPWREAADEDFKFALGDQWTTEEREQLKEEKRPCLTFNKIEALIDLVGGWQRENSARIRVYPEGGEDKVFSEIADKCLKQIDKQTKLNYKLDHQFDDGMICGKAWMEMAIDYDKDPINGQLIFRNVDVFQVLKDPDGKEYDQSDWDYIIKLTKYSKDRLKKLYPDKSDVIDKLQEDNLEYLMAGDVLKEGDSDNYHLGKTSRDAERENAIGSKDYEDKDEKYMLKEYWHKKYEKKYCVFNADDNSLDKYDNEKEAEAKKAEIMAKYQAQFDQAQVEYERLKKVEMAGQMIVGEAKPLSAPPVFAPPEVRIVKRTVSVMKYAATAAGELLQEPDDSPFAPHYQGFPIFNYWAKWYVSSKDPELSVKGITRNVIDPQKEINKSRSQFLHILNTSANSGWIGEKDALTQEGWKDLAKMGASPGVIVQTKPGKQLQRIDPSNPSTANLMRGEKADQEIKEISGINPDAMAVQDKTTSGKAISLRIRQALTILAKYFRNFRYTKEMIGTAIFAMIPEVYNVGSIKKVLGTDWMKKNQVDDGIINSFLQQVKDGRYDMEITEADSSQTIRQETFENLVDLANAGMPIPPDVILEFSAMPNSKEIVDRVKEFMQSQAQAEQGQGGKKKGSK